MDWLIFTFLSNSKKLSCKSVCNGICEIKRVLKSMTTRIFCWDWLNTNRKNSFIFWRVVFRLNRKFKWTFFTSTNTALYYIRILLSFRTNFCRIEFFKNSIICLNIIYIILNIWINLRFSLYKHNRPQKEKFCHFRILLKLINSIKWMRIVI